MNNGAGEVDMGWHVIIASLGMALALGRCFGDLSWYMGCSR